MADSTVIDVSKMKVVDLRKELKSRGLSYAGDKAELVARLQAAISEDDHGDINLDSDEIDSDGVLEDEEDKSQNDLLDDSAVDTLNEELDSAVDTLNEELALQENSPEKQVPESKPQRILKRKITEPKVIEGKETIAKKIVLNRSASVSSNTVKPPEDKKEIMAPESDKPEIIVSSNKVKITADIDPKTRLEMRAKRFGLPVKMTEDQRKEARKQRFNQNANSVNSDTAIASSGTLSHNLEKLKMRAERFGQSVSAIMTDIETKEKLEKRKAKFNAAK